MVNGSLKSSEDISLGSLPKNNFSLVSIWLWVSYRNMSFFQIFPFVSGSMIYFLYFNEIYDEIYALTLFCIIYLQSRSKEIWSKKPPITFANNTINQCSSACHIYLFPTQVQSLSDARFSPIVKFSGFSTYPIFQSGRQHPAKSSRKQQIEKNASGVCYFLALTKASELVEVIDLARYSPNTNLGGRKKATRWSFSFGSGKKIYSQLYFPASWEVSHFSIPINEPADLLKWMAHSTFSGNCQSFKRYEMLMGCPWSYLQETTFFH